MTTKEKIIEEKETKEIALQLASMLASQTTDNFGDSIVETAKIYKDLTGKDLGIKTFEKINNRIKTNQTLTK